MLATIRNRTLVLLLICCGALLTSFATNKETALINDPDSRKETALPWNEQQKWEREGEGGMLNQQRR